MSDLNESVGNNPAGSTQITSVQQIFSTMNYICKLAGGHPFTHRNARLMIAYRIVMVVLSRFLRGIYFTPITHFKEISSQSSNQIDVTSFYVLYASSDVALSISTIITGALYHRTLTLVLRKRLDGDYLRPISKWLTKQTRQETSNRHPPGGHSTDSVETLRTKLNERLQLGQEAIQCKLDEHFVSWNEVTLARCSIVLAVALTAGVAFIREEYGNFHVAKSHFNTSANSLASDGIDQKLNHATRRHLSYLQSSQKSSLFDLGLQIAFDLPVVGLVHLTLAVLEFFQNYGQIGLGLLSTACMTEMLKRIKEQEKMRLARNKDLSAGLKTEQRQAARTTPSRSKFISDPHDLTCSQIQTTELLVHIRDVLITLRSALTLDYLFANIFDICRLVTIFGSLVTMLNAQRYGWALIITIEYIRINVITIACRLNYHRLHNEAASIKCLIYERLVNVHMEPNGSVGSLESSSRIESITNYRLAKEIEELWPTDWFVPDIKSCLSQNFLVVAFVATLQQLVDMRSQLK